MFYVTAIAAICSVLSLAGNMIGVVIMLYVRSEVKPLSTEIRLLNSSQTEIKTTQNNLWEKIGSQGQRLSDIEGQMKAERQLTGREDHQ